jgi:ABC-type nickel/cobalt efflux system permease component RcnA
VVCPLFIFVVFISTKKFTVVHSNRLIRLKNFMLMTCVYADHNFRTTWTAHDLRTTSRSLLRAVEVRHDHTWMGGSHEHSGQRCCPQSKSPSCHDLRRAGTVAAWWWI